MGKGSGERKTGESSMEDSEIRRKRINESIEMKDWDEYFRNLLGGVE